MPNLTELQLELSALSPREILKKALANHEHIAVSFSGAEDVVLVDMISKLSDAPKIFTLDTGRLHPEKFRGAVGVRLGYQSGAEGSGGESADRA